jgi:hypothetical protein
MVAKCPGALGNSLRISMCPSSQAFSANLTVTDSLRANAVTAGDTTININGTPNAAANLIAGDLGLTTAVIHDNEFIQTQIQRYIKAEIESYHDLLKILQTNKEA